MLGNKWDRRDKHPIIAGNPHGAKAQSLLPTIGVPASPQATGILDVIKSPFQKAVVEILSVF